MGREDRGEGLTEGEMAEVRTAWPNPPVIGRRAVLRAATVAMGCAVAASILAMPRRGASAAGGDGLPPLTGPFQSFALANPRPAAPDFPFKRETGTIGTLSDYRGRVVLVNLWATWCAPCVREMPSLDRLQAYYDPADVLVMPISLDRGGAFQVRRFYGEHDLNRLEIFLDPGMTGMRMLGARGVPATILVDRMGREVGRMEGAAEWDAPEVRRLIDHLRGEQSAPEIERT